MSKTTIKYTPPMPQSIKIDKLNPGDKFIFVYTSGVPDSPIFMVLDNKLSCNLYSGSTCQYRSDAMVYMLDCTIEVSVS